MIVMGRRSSVRPGDPIGGAMRAFDITWNAVTARDKEASLIDLNFRNYKYQSRVIAFFSVMMLLLSRLFKDKEIFVNLSNKNIRVWGALVLVATHILGAKYGVRLFGGRFDIYFRSCSRWEKWVVRAVINRSVFLCLETKVSLEWARMEFPRAKLLWLPNTRKKHDRWKYKDERALYLGLVSDGKGVDYIFKGRENIPSISLYGPLGMLSEEIKGSDWFKDVYKGILDPKDVPKVMASSMCLIFPSKEPSEGYPGVIIEAMSVGLPVLAPRTETILEILGDNYPLTYKPNSYSDFESRISCLTESELQAASCILLERFSDFDSDRVLDVFFTKAFDNFLASRSG